MSTAYDTIYDLFLANIQYDPLIDAAYAASTPTGEAYIKPFLIKGLTGFDNCEKDLEDRNDTTQVFTDTLTTLEKAILADLMTMEWLKKEINDVMQMKNHLQDRAFRTHATGQNLSAKKDLFVVFTELAQKKMTQYEYKYLDWDTI